MIDSIDRMVDTLRSGGLVLYPTDTVWAIGCDATNADAVKRIRTLREWPPEEGLVVIVPTMDKLKTIIKSCNPRIETLLAYHRRPLTVVYERMYGLTPEVCAADGSVAIRVVHNSFLQELFKSFDKPLVASVPAKVAEAYPKHFGEISSDFLQAVDFVVMTKDNPEDTPEPSVIIRLDEYDEIEYIRR